MRSLCAVVSALLILTAPVFALAAEVGDGAIPGNGRPWAGEQVSGWDGTSHRVLRTDASGVLRIAEDYPYQLQNDRFPAADTSNTVINGVLRPIGLGWSVSPFGARTVTVTRVQKGTANTLKLYLFGSDDNVNYYPIISSQAFVPFANAGVAVADTIRVDTLMCTIPTQFSGSNSVRQFKIVLPEEVYPGRYLQIWATRTDSAYASNAMHVGLTYEGRWK